MWKEKMTSLTDLRARGRVMRTLAGVLVLAVLFGASVPPFALAESDNEGQGTAPPGARPPGLEVAGVEAGGEETALGEVPIAPGEEEVEELVPPAAGEESSKPAPPAAPPVAEPPAAATEPEAASTGAAPETPAGPAPAQPNYEAEEPTTSYEPAPTPARPVRGEAIVEPGTGTASDPSRAGGQPSHRRQATVTQPVEESPPAPEPAEAPEQSTVSMPPSTPPEKAASLKGQRTYRVVAGDCLWTIAAAILPSTASEEQVAAEVERIWNLNAARIGTGDPDLIEVGTVLRLP